MISTVFRARRFLLALIAAAAALDAQVPRPTPAITATRGSLVNTPACRLSITEYVGNTLLLKPR
jgi:hypothetical protein